MHGKQFLYYPINPETQQVKLMEEYNCKNGLKTVFGNNILNLEQ